MHAKYRDAGAYRLVMAELTVAELLVTQVRPEETFRVGVFTVVWTYSHLVLSSLSLITPTLGAGKARTKPAVAPVGKHIILQSCHYCISLCRWYLALLHSARLWKLGGFQRR